jgi:hypothetical protein
MEQQQLKRPAESDDTKAAKKTCTDRDAVQAAIPDAGVLRDFIGKHLSANELNGLLDIQYGMDIMNFALRLARCGRISIDYQFRKFACELVGLECTEKEPAFFSMISKNMEEPLQKLKARIAEGGVRFDRASISHVLKVMMPHRDVMAEAYVKGVTELVCDMDWDYNEYREDKDWNITTTKVENKLRKRARLESISLI